MLGLGIRSWGVSLGAERVLGLGIGSWDVLVVAVLVLGIGSWGVSLVAARFPERRALLGGTHSSSESISDPLLLATSNSESDSELDLDTDESSLVPSLSIEMISNASSLLNILFDILADGWQVTDRWQVTVTDGVTDDDH